MIKYFSELGKFYVRFSNTGKHALVEKTQLGTGKIIYIPIEPVGIIKKGIIEQAGTDFETQKIIYELVQNRDPALTQSGLALLLPVAPNLLKEPTPKASAKLTHINNYITNNIIVLQAGTYSKRELYNAYSDSTPVTARLTYAHFVKKVKDESERHDKNIRIEHKHKTDELILRRLT